MVCTHPSFPDSDYFCYCIVTAKDKPEIAKKRDSLSRVTYELTPMGALVKLRLIHENLLPEDFEKDPNTFQGINNGWPAVISSLKSLLETGEPIRFSVSCS